MTTPLTTPHPGPILELDTETTRLRRPYLEGGRRVWEIGGRRVEPDGHVTPLQMFIRIRDLRLQELLTSRFLEYAQVAIGDEFAPDGQIYRPGAGGPRALPIEGQWFDYLPPDVQMSLQIGGFHQRHPELGGVGGGDRVYSVAEAAERLMAGPWFDYGPTIVGAVPNFDDLSLHQLLYDAGAIGPDEEPWDYHLLDARTYAAGALGWSPRWETKELNAALKVDTSDLTAHRAVDDAIWAGRLFRAARQLAASR